MSLSLLAFVPADRDPPETAAVAAAVDGEIGAAVDGSPDADYRPWRWRDPLTGARCLGDIGRAPLDEDPIHADREYPGWQPAGLAIHVPVTGPHWVAQELAELAGRIAARLPDLAWLNTEDIRRDDEEEGPGPISGDRLVGSRDQLLTSFLDQRDPLPSMPRPASRSLWRYRREVTRLRTEHGSLLWPGLLVLGRDDRALRATMWMSCEQDLALPPVDLIVIRREDGSTGVLPADELLATADRGEPIDEIGNRRIRMDARVRDLHAHAKLADPSGYRALDELDWVD